MVQGVPLLSIPGDFWHRANVHDALRDRDIGTLFRLVKRYAGASQRTIGTATGLGQGYVNKLVNGRVAATELKVFDRIADGCRMPDDCRIMLGLAPQHSGYQHGIVKTSNTGKDRLGNPEPSHDPVRGSARPHRFERDTSVSGEIMEPEDESVKRSDFLRATGLALAGTVTGAGLPQTRLAGLASGIDDEQLLLIASASYRKLESRTPSADLVSPVKAHLEFSSSIARERAGHRQQQFQMVVSEVAGLAAWLYVDLAQTANARHHYRLAISAATRSGNFLLVAYMRASLGQFAASHGNATQGLRLIRQAREQLPKTVPPVASVWLDTMEASALAELRDAQALRLLASVERRLDGPESEAVWPWLFRFDHQKVARYRAAAAVRLGDLRLSEREFDACWDSFDVPKQRALMQVERATALAGRGEIERACSDAVAAFDTGRAYGSQRVLHAVTTFREGLPGDLGSTVAELDDRLQSVYDVPE